jgi:hypothetical protein
MNFHLSLEFEQAINEINLLLKIIYENIKKDFNCIDNYIYRYMFIFIYNESLIR